MTYYPQGSCIIKIDNASSSLTDFSAQISGITLNTGNMVGKFHTFGTGTARNQYSLDGGLETNGSIDVINSDVATELFHVIRQWQTAGGTKTVEIGVPDLTTSGSYKITFEARMGMRNNAVQGKAGSGDPQTMSVAFEADGNVTESTI